MKNSFSLDIHNNQSTLVENIVTAFTKAIKEKQWGGDTKLPSIRQCAKLYNVSVFTMTESYNRLAASGLIYAKNRSGYFITPHHKELETLPSTPSLIELPIDDYWLLKNIFDQTSQYTHFSCGWLPPDWYPQETLAKTLREISKQDISQSGYGEPYGYFPLRQQLCHHLSDYMIHVATNNILITQGASSALDIIASTLLRPGETVLVDEPGYCNFLSSLRYKGMKLVGIPWHSQGPDLDIMEKLIKQEKPRFYFTNPWLQNPTGASLTVDNAYKLVRITEQYKIKIVEDNVSGDLMPKNSITLVSMAGLDQVIHIRSFCKTLQPSLRVGYIVANQNVLEQLVHYKMMTNLTSSELSERVILSILRTGYYHKHAEKLRQQLSKAHIISTRLLTSLGWELFSSPENGYYLYARPKNSSIDSEQLTELAKNKGIILAHGRLFSPDHASNAWIRFNVVYVMLKQNILKSFLLSLNHGVLNLEVKQDKI